MRAVAPVGIVILAAGASTRLGTPKQLLRLDDRSLLRRTLETALASAGRPVTLVLGSMAAQMHVEAAGLPVEIVENPDWPEGVASSIRMGLASIQETNPAVGAVLFLVCDQPLVTSDLLNRIIEIYHKNAPRLIASAYGGGLGVPALFSRELFPELARLRGSIGAKQILLQHRSEAMSVPFPEGELDIDSEEDYNRFLEQLQSS